MLGTPFIIASQCKSWSSETGARDWRIGEGSERESLSSWRRRFVAGGLGDREIGAMVGEGIRGCANMKLLRAYDS